MRSTRQLVLGFGLMIVGLVIVGVSTLVASRDVVVGLVFLMLIPLAISLCGAGVAFVGLARHREVASRSAVVRKIVGLAGIAGVAFGLGFPALGILSQLPDYAAGLNGTFISGSTAGFAAFFLVGVGLLVGLGIGAVLALAWWSVRGRNLPGRIATPRS